LPTFVFGINQKHNMPDSQLTLHNLLVVSDAMIGQPKEHFEDLLRNPDVRIERIVSTGQTTPEGIWYDQAEDEWVALLQGEATLQFGNGTIMKLKPGDYLLIPAHRKHRVTFTSTQPPAIWLAIFLTTRHHDQ